MTVLYSSWSATLFVASTAFKMSLAFSFSWVESTNLIFFVECYFLSSSLQTFPNSWTFFALSLWLLVVPSSMHSQDFSIACFMRWLLRFRLNRFCALTFGVFACTLDTLIVIKFSRSDSSAHRSELQPSFSGSTKINSLVIQKRFKSADTVAYSSTRRELDLALARHSSRYSWHVIHTSLQFMWLTAATSRYLSSAF